MGTAPAEAPQRAGAGTVRGSAFGINVVSPSPLAGLAPPVDGRSTRWSVVGDDGLRQLWETSGAQTLVHLRYESGRTFLRVDRACNGLFRILTPRHGRHVVAADGSRVWSVLPTGAPPARWQRLLYAQPLPLAAGLLELELFHASAVCVSGRAVALVAPSGTGKTSVAAHLVASGSEFFTDDILALDRGGAGLVAYPGPARLAVTATELRAVPEAARDRLGPVIGRTDKLLTAPPKANGPRALAAVVFLSRGDEHAKLRIAVDEAPSARRLLGSAFLPYLDTADRLRRRLDACAEVARDIPCFEVEIPSAARAADVAETLLGELVAL